MEVGVAMKVAREEAAAAAAAGAWEAAQASKRTEADAYKLKRVRFEHDFEQDYMVVSTLSPDTLRVMFLYLQSLHEFLQRILRCWPGYLRTGV